MKKGYIRILIAALLLCLFTVGATACDTSADEGGEEESRYVFDESTPPMLIYSSDVPQSAVNALYSALRDTLGTPPEYSLDTSEAGGHEIVIGNTSRDISKKAMRKLRLAQRDDEYSAAFLIYSSGNSVAIVYDEAQAEFAAKAAAEYFAENYLGKTSLLLDAGVVASDTVSVLDYYDEIDNEYQAEKWRLLESYIGGESGAAIVEALKKLYLIYDDGVATWFPNLYDPAVGGFYYSNSARDTEGFLPDIESTGQALGFISGSGMLQGTGSSEYASVLSDEIKTQIITFLRGLQDPNGFFYHPQWGKELTDTKLSRRARDLSYAVGVLDALGSSPVYDTPSGVAGDHVLPTAKITTPVSTSRATLVSYAVAAASYDPIYENLDTVKAYLESLENSGRTFYDIGNEMTSQMSQIIERDKDLGTFGTANSLAKCIVNWFNEHQYAETGHWEPVANYAGVNSLLKISGVYNAAGEPIPNAGRAAQSAMDAITSDEPLSGIVDIYNTWYAVGNVIKNLRNYGGIGANEQADAILAELRANAPTGLAATAEKLKLYKREDGSFSYYQDKSCTQSQGMIVSAPEGIEGDVNGTVLATNSIMSVIYYALDMSGYMVPIFGQRELCIYLTTLNSLGPVQKITGSDEEDYSVLDFEEDAVGEHPESVTSKLVSAGASVSVSNYGGEGGNVLTYKTSAGGGDYLYVKNEGAAMNSCYVFDTRIRFLSEGKNEYEYCYQIFMDSAFLLAVTQKGGRVILSEMTTSSAQTAIMNEIATLDFDRWYSLRIEYYTGNTSTVRIKIYIDGELISVSDNYYNKRADLKPTPYASGCKQLSFYAFGSAQMTVELDDVFYGTTKDKYTPATESDTKVIYNVDKTQ